MIKKYLITTPLEEKIYSNKKNKILLGDWCLDYKFFLEKTKRSKTLKNRWDNYNLRKKDYIYLKKIFFKLLNSIPNKMNIYHKTKHKKEFWKLLLWVWLSYYIPIQYFRWKTINDLIYKAKEKFVYSEDLWSKLDSLNNFCNEINFDKTLNLLRQLVPEWYLDD